jgi:hypothetical protein
MVLEMGSTLSKFLVARKFCQKITIIKYYITFIRIKEKKSKKITEVVLDLLIRSRTMAEKPFAFSKQEK